MNSLSEDSFSQIGGETDAVLPCPLWGYVLRRGAAQRLDANRLAKHQWHSAVQAGRSEAEMA